MTDPDRIPEGAEGSLIVAQVVNTRLRVKLQEAYAQIREMERVKLEDRRAA